MKCLKYEQLFRGFKTLGRVKLEMKKYSPLLLLYLVRPAQTKFLQQRSLAFFTFTHFRLHTFYLHTFHLYTFYFCASCLFSFTFQSAQPFVLPQKPLIAVAGTNPELRQIAEQFAKQLSLATGRNTRVFAGNFRVKNGINFVVSKDPKLGKGNYFLEVTSQQITITAEQTAGFRNGLKALLKLMPVEISNPTKNEGIKWEVPCSYVESNVH